ncbi:Hsp70 suppressor, GTPase facilitates ribosomal subunit dissociation [Arthrobotrys musiformis]|uniref:Elongation factor 1 alpha-like protein n=1 Tax=Arthrobotrys musiformis TaxID=47236 RepID=A0AAV9WGB5_9PEZI
MSRHKMVRTMNLVDELDDYDGEDDYYEEEEEGMSSDDKARMADGLRRVREVIGSDVPSITNEKIEETLWYYYFDVEKSITYLLNQVGATEKKKQKKAAVPEPKAPTQKAAIKAKQAFDVPSPDDVVIAAQSQSKGISKTGKGEKPGSSTTASIQKGVEALKVGDTSEKPAPPKIPRKKIDVVAEYEKSKSKRKENANLVVIGHVDAGKSTLMGRLLYDCGVVDERTIQKYKQEAEKIGKSSFALAWVLDQTGEERARGVTIDIAVNAFETPRGRYTILDAPGHRDFIPNMIAGAAQADFAVLVIDSSPGEFEAGFNVRGQTKEHALLVRSMGVQRIIVAVNKLDLMHWDKERFDEIKQQMSQFLTTAGFQAKNVSFIPCSGLTGDNIARKPADGLISWYSGPTLVEELETAKPVTKAIEKPLRMTIADVYRGGVTNPVTISGRIEIGNIQVGDTIIAVPGDEKATVKGIEVDNQAADWAVAGNNVQLHLANIEMEYLKIGDVICQADSPLVPLKEFEAKILAFESLTPMMIDIHRGRLNASGRITKLVATLDKGNGSVTKKKPRHIGPGSLAVVNIAVTGAPLPLEKGSKIVLRADGLTVAAGVVE